MTDRHREWSGEPGGISLSDHSLCLPPPQWPWWSPSSSAGCPSTPNVWWPPSPSTTAAPWPTWSSPTSPVSSTTHVHQPSAVLHHEPQVPGGVQGKRICSATSSAPPHETRLTFLRFSLAQAMFFRRPSGAVLVGPRGSSGRGATLEKDPRGQPARGYARGGEPTSSRTAQVRMQRGSGGRVGVTRKNFQATAATVAPERKVSSHPLLTRDPSSSVK